MTKSRDLKDKLLPNPEETERTSDGGLYTTNLQQLLGHRETKDEIVFAPGGPTNSGNSAAWFQQTDIEKLTSKQDNLLDRIQREISKINNEAAKNSKTPVVIKIQSSDYVPTRCDTCCKVFCSCKHLCENGCCEMFGGIVACSTVTFATIGLLGGAVTGNIAYCKTNCWIDTKDSLCHFISPGVSQDESCCCTIIPTCIVGMGFCCVFTGVTVAGAIAGAVAGAITGATVGSVVGSVAAPAIVAITKAENDFDSTNELRKMISEYNAIVEQLKQKNAHLKEPQIAHAPKAPSSQLC